MNSSDKFVDTGKTINDYSLTILVHCPSCTKLAYVKPSMSHSQNEENPYILHIPRRLTCTNCGFVKEQHRRRNVTYKYNQKLICIGSPYDWYFGCRLFLSTNVAGHELWFINRDHLADVEKFLTSKLRNSSKYHYSMISRLPKWMIDSKNKSEVLKSINRLKNKYMESCK